MADRRRSVTFLPSRPAQEPVRKASIAVAGSNKPVDLNLRRTSTTGPIGFLNPTSAIYAPPQLPEAIPERSHSPDSGQSSNDSPGLEKADPTTQKPFPGITSADRHALEQQVQFQWRARDNRKGRHSIAILPPLTSTKTNVSAPEISSSPRVIGQNILRMFTFFPYWDISYLVALAFTLGSVDWCLNAFFVWLPFVAPSTEFPDEILTAGGATAFIGATIFEIGSWLLFFEAVNENHSSCFGWELEQKLEKGGLIHIRPDKSTCRHHHQRTMADSDAALECGESSGPDDMEELHRWRWFPTWQALRLHYLHELGFLASLTQLLAATVFWISGIVALPGIINHIPNQAVLNGVYWIPQMVGGSGFILSGLLFTIETQRNWYTPAPHVLGWWVGAWNFVGGLGFTLCGCLGPAYGNSGAQYEASLATFWGSWAFLIGSTIQWYECLDKNPVERKGRGMDGGVIEGVEA